MSRRPGVRSAPAIWPRIILALVCLIGVPDPLFSQLQPTAALGLGLAGYRATRGLEGGLVVELSGGAEWPGRTRIEIGGRATFGGVSCSLSSSCPTIPIGDAETIGMFGQIARLLGEQGVGARFVLAARAGFEHLRRPDQFGFSASGRAGGEFSLGAKTALTATGHLGWVTFNDANPLRSTDYTGLRVGVDIGLRLYPSG